MMLFQPFYPFLPRVRKVPLDIRCTKDVNICILLLARGCDRLETLNGQYEKLYQAYLLLARGCDRLETQKQQAQPEQEPPSPTR